MSMSHSCFLSWTIYMNVKIHDKRTEHVHFKKIFHTHSSSFLFKSQCRCFCIQNPGITMDLRIRWVLTGSLRKNWEKLTREPEKGQRKRKNIYKTPKKVGIHSSGFLSKTDQKKTGKENQSHPKSVTGTPPKSPASQIGCWPRRTVGPMAHSPTQQFAPEKVSIPKVGGRKNQLPLIFFPGKPAVFHFPGVFCGYFQHDVISNTSSRQLVPPRSYTRTCHTSKDHQRTISPMDC